MSKFSKRFTETTRITLEWEYFCSKKKPPTLEMTQQSTTSHSNKKMWGNHWFIRPNAKPRQTSSSHDSHFGSNKMPPTLQNSSTINH
jgi:hypothetical protein